MSLATVRSFAFAGIEAVPVEVQVQISSGLPAFLVVGLPDKAVGEARERVRAALTAMGLSLPPKRVLINLAPADLLKEGSHFDLPMALAVLAAMEVLPREDISHYAAIGELSLDGSLNPVVGVLPAAIGAGLQELGLICPGCQGGEAAWAGSVEVLAPPDLLSLINHFRGSQVLTPPDPAGLATAGSVPDLAEVKGMETARRALEIAAAGGHNLLLVGPPGAGKSMLAARLPGLLPDLLPAEALEVSMIHSVAGLLDGGRLLRRPPFREPHHGASQAALAGGGCEFQRFPGLNTGKLDSDRCRFAGEAALAHRGVLLVGSPGSLSVAALEEFGSVVRSGRAVPTWSKGGAPIPADTLVVMTVDADPSVDVHDPVPERLAALFDLAVAVAPVRPEARRHLSCGEPTPVVAARVERARRAACPRRQAGTDRQRAVYLEDPAAAELVADAAACFMLDAGQVASASRVARTIADLAGSAAVAPRHVAEALSFRHRRSGASRAA